jgi:hypothetical protein
MSPLGGFDQVIAITQKHINDNLAARFKLYKSLQAFTAKVEDEEDGSMQGTMDPPTVELVIPSEPRKAGFLLHFSNASALKKGSTFKFRSKLDGDDKKTMHTLPMDGWTLAFIANLAPRSLQNVPDEMPSVISEDICQKIEAAGSYSLQQIIIDVRTSDVLSFDLAHSVTRPGSLCDARSKPGHRQGYQAEEGPQRLAVFLPTGAVERQSQCPGVRRHR